jgi:hypothetical protein
VHRAAHLLFDIIAGDRLLHQADAQHQFEKPQLQFTTGDAGKAAAKDAMDALLKQMDALKQYGALQKSIEEAGAAITKQEHAAMLADVKFDYDSRLISEREYIDESNKLQIKQAEQVAALKTAEREAAQKLTLDMIALAEKLPAASKQRFEADKKIEQQRIALVKLLGDEKVAQDAVTIATQKWGYASTLYNQKVMDQMRQIERATQDQVRAMQDQTAAKQQELALIGATPVQQQTAITQMEYANKLRDNEIAQKRVLADIEAKRINADVGKAQLDALQGVNAELVKQRDNQLKIIPLTEQQLRHVENLRNAWQGIDAFAFDAFEKILDKGQDAWKDLAASLKKTMIRALYELTIQRWTLNMFAQMAGAPGADMSSSSGS